MATVTLEALMARAPANDNAACQEWQGARTAGGYGVVRMRGRLWYAHRLAWTLGSGAIPHGLDVLHKCDNPPCITPAHLFLGTARDNGVDMARKGRSRSSIPPDLLRQAMRAVADGESQSAVARRLGISRHAIVDALRGRAWQWLTAA